ncbi:hypothetical protein CDAR_81921 [Caerostris darwini]|uniref:Secreted protein n=1 Tax=Caerostris darwini TaxID=1538125 RepID=A0AAV4V6X8_9ARAC|nr:hypothetical protein CDAR_81921 [Caerostris darwini]
MNNRHLLFYSAIIHYSLGSQRDEPVARTSPERRGKVKSRSKIQHNCSPTANRQRGDSVKDTNHWRLHNSLSFTFTLFVFLHAHLATWTNTG